MKELIYIAVSATNSCTYCIASHTASARAKGVTDAELMELVSIIGMANATNRMVTALQVPVDEAFLSRSGEAGMPTIGETYDFIVVGGGSSGCVAAARLVTDAGARVLLLEAGHSHRHPLLDMPPGIFKMINGSKYHALPPDGPAGTSRRARRTTSRRPTCSAAARR